MSYEALYRLWRPKRFEDVIGQEHITTTLRNQIKYDRIVHAYIFSGTRGTGKTSTARIFAKAVNCLEPSQGDPCNKCKVCHGIESASVMDVIEMDAASNRGIDEIRELLEKVNYPPTLGKYKVYIIDEVHMLTQGAYNALLKTLEEPPRHVIFILATTEIHKMPATILSRCQRFDFKRITVRDMARRMDSITKEMGIEIEKRALELVAKNAEGAMRDALSILDQCLSLSQGNGMITYGEVVDTLGLASESWLGHISQGIITKDIHRSMEYLHQMIDGGRDIHQIVKQLIEYFRDILMVKTLPRAEKLLELTREQIASLAELGKGVSEERLFYIINLLNETEVKMRESSQPSIILEMSLIRLCKTPEGNDLASLIERIRVLEERIGGEPRKPAQPKFQGKEETIEKPQQGKVQAERMEAGKVPEKKIEERGASMKKPQDHQESDPSESDKNKPTSRITLDSFKKRWDDILQGVKKHGGVQLEALLKEGQPAQYKDHCLAIAFDLGFHQAKLSEKENTQLIQEVVSQLMGEPIRVVCLMWDQIYPTETQADDLVVEKAIEIFGEDVVEIVGDED